MTDNNFGRRPQANDDVVEEVRKSAPKKQFFHFRQNNSGGTFDYDAARGIAENVWIEADDKEHAIYRAERIGIYFNGVEKGMDCPCCGDRWSSPYDATDAPEVDKLYGCYIHYADGHITKAERTK